MKNYFLILFLLYSISKLNAQGIQMGGNYSFFNSNTLSFGNELNLNPNLVFDDQSLSFGKVLKTTRGTSRSSFDLFLNYFIGNSFYLSLDYRRMRNDLTINGNETNNDIHSPIFDTRFHSTTIGIGYSSKRIFGFFAEGGIGKLKAKFIWDDFNSIYENDGMDYSVYTDYLNNQINGTNAYFQIGYKLVILNLSLRYDFYFIKSSNQRIELKTRPGVYLGMYFPVSLIKHEQINMDNINDFDQISNFKKVKQHNLERRSLEFGYMFSSVTPMSKTQVFGPYLDNNFSTNYELKTNKSYQFHSYAMRFKWAPFNRPNFFTALNFGIALVSSDQKYAKAYNTYIPTSNVVVSNITVIKYGMINYGAQFGIQLMLPNDLKLNASTLFTSNRMYYSGTHEDYKFFKHKNYNTVGIEVGLKKKHWAVYAEIAKSVNTKSDAFIQPSSLFNIRVITDYLFLKY